ncbi:hypothetical protein Sbal183_1152 [Shewanella baltica OS183]|nr:hypothetical protein Sbal175_3147 [Shewanella baltica BA175]EHQ14075.1 hypothetical protein Sbal183_1152 [Shewanella baltica OS183]
MYSLLIFLFELGLCKRLHKASLNYQQSQRQVALLLQYYVVLACSFILTHCFKMKPVLYFVTY